MICHATEVRRATRSLHLMAMERGPHAAHAPGECARLERMRTALDKFLTLIDDKAKYVPR